MAKNTVRVLICFYTIMLFFWSVSASSPYDQKMRLVPDTQSEQKEQMEHEDVLSGIAMNGVVDGTWARKNPEALASLIRNHLTPEQVIRDVLPLLGDLNSQVVQAVHEKYPYIFLARNDALLCSAVEPKNFEVVKALLDCKVDVDTDRESNNAIALARGLLAGAQTRADKKTCNKIINELFCAAKAQKECKARAAEQRRADERARQQHIPLPSATIAPVLGSINPPVKSFLKYSVVMPILLLPGETVVVRPVGWREPY